MTKFKRLLALTLIFVGAFGLAGCKEEEVGPTDLEQLAEALEELELASSASSDLTLLSTGLHDIEITWTSSNTAVIATDGTLTIPLFTEGDKVVTITASLTLGDDTLTKAFEVTVLAAATITDAELLDEAAGRLLLAHDDLVDVDISLPLTVDLTDITEDVIVAWASSDETVMSATGEVTRPANGDGNANITLTATLTYAAETTTKTFPITVKEEAPSTAFTTVAAIHPASTLGDIVEFQGIVTATFNGGYFLTDGTNAIGIYTGTYTDFVIGDEVLVKGSYAKYNSLYQIGNPTVEDLKSSGNTIPLTATDMTVAEILALDSTDHLIHGMYYSVTGTIGLCGSYDNVCINDGDDSFLVYYKSLPDSVSALEDKVGMKVIIEVIYYTDHATDGVLVVFQGGAADIEISALNDVDALAADLAAVDATVPGVTLSNITLPAEGPNGTLYTNWTSDMLDVMLSDGSFVAIAGTTVTVTFTADAERGTETGTATVEVVVPVLSTIGEVLEMNNGDYFQVSGIVYEESHYGFFIHADGNYIFVFASDLVDSVIPGQEITIEGFLGSYSGLSQINVVSYTVGSTQNGLVGTVISSVIALENDLVQRGTVAMVTGTVSIEGSYDNVYITGPAGGKVVVYYRSNAGELEEFAGDIITLTVVTYQNATVLYQGVAAGVTVQTAYTDKQLAKASADAIDLGDIANVEADMTLPSENTDTGATITWATSDAAVITAAGVIERVPGVDVTATLTATVTVGTEVKTRSFVIIVLDANGATPINVAAALALTDGDSVLVVGVVTGFYYDEPMIQDADGTAIHIDGGLDVEVGDEVVIRGTLDTATSYGDNQRKLINISLIDNLSSGNPLFIFDTYTAETVYTSYPASSSQRITLTNVVIALLDDGWGYAFLDTGVTTGVGEDMTDALKFKFPDYWLDVYAEGDTLASITFNVVDIDFSNMRISAVELPELTEAQNMLAAKATINIPDDVTSDLDMVVAIEDYNATVVWTSTVEAVIALNGTVVRPLAGEAAVEVTLTAAVTVGSTTETMTFVVSVLAIVPPELFFSEYAENGNEKALEIYNPTGAEVDLTLYSIKISANGVADWTGTLDLTGTLAAGETLVIVYSSSTQTLKDMGDVISGTLGFNGDDALGLFKDGVLMDMIGVLGETSWKDQGIRTDDTVIYRDSSIIAPNATWNPSEWVEGIEDDHSDLGTHTTD